MMRVLVTGGLGRLGTTICEALLKEGFQVRMFDLSNTENRKNARSLYGRTEIHWGDIVDADSVRGALEGVDVVVHMAAILPPVANEKPELATRVNVGGIRILVNLLKEKGESVPLIYTSSAAVFGPTPGATEPISPDTNEPNPDGTYGKTKLRAENIIKEAGIEHVILRLSATMYLIFRTSDLKRMFTVPLNNRVEYCHPDDTAVAVVNAIRKFDIVKGKTLVISGGPEQRMLYKDMIAKILHVLGLPLPPAHKFTRKPYYLDWYDTSSSQGLLNFQNRTFTDYLNDYRERLVHCYTPLFLPFMRHFVGPLFGKLITRFI
jgi:nucleoside-diphosphate-sugar epimerase